MRILREVAPGTLLDNPFIFFNYFFQGPGIEIGIELCLLLLLLRVEHFVKRMFGNFQHHIAKHLNQAPVGIGGKARVVAAPGQRLNILIVQTQVEDRIHHAWHGEFRT